MAHNDQHRRSPLAAIGRGLVYVVFLALLAVRRPIQIVLRLVAGCATLAAIFLFIGSTGMRSTAIGAACAAFAAFVIGWFYDQLLLRLSPQPLFLAR